MGRYRGQGNKGRSKGGAGFTSPKIPKGRKRADSDDKKKSPLLQHFFFWTVLISLFMGIFGGFNQVIQSIVLWNDVYTLFGAIAYWDATIGWLVTLVFFMSVDLILVSK